MSKPRDATMKALLEIRPGDWLPFLGQPAMEPVTLIDADVSTVTAAGDKVIHVGGSEPWLLHLEFQSGGDDSLVRRMLQYNVLLDVRHDLPVRSVAILLHPSANSSVPSDVYVRQLPDGQRTLEFRFGVVRVWQLPVEPVLQGGLAVLPLAPLCAVDDAALPAVIRRMDQRLREETEPAAGGQLMNAAFVLAGLRLPPTALAQLFAGVVAMRESSGYQLILAEGRAEGLAEGRAEGRVEGRTEGRVEGRTEGRAEGRVEEARKFLLMFGESRFGRPDSSTAATLNAIDDIERLELLGKRLFEVNNWQELLGKPAPRSRSRRKE